MPSAHCGAPTRSGPFTINTVEAGSDREPVIAGAGNSVMVTWSQDDGTPAMDEVVATTRFPLFLDSFESGDTSAWSATISPP